VLQVHSAEMEEGRLSAPTVSFRELSFERAPMSSGRNLRPAQRSSSLPSSARRVTESGRLFGRPLGWRGLGARKVAQELGQGGRGVHVERETQAELPQVSQMLHSCGQLADAVDRQGLELLACPEVRKGQT